MGRFLNPNNSAFQIALNSKIYVDKTELLEITNQSINTDIAFICNSRPRRFGKSITANMLTAYYSKGCDSEEMFSNLKISASNSFKKHLNQYDVIHVDIQWCMEVAGGAANIVSFLTENIIKELKSSYQQELNDTVNSLPDALSRINAETGAKFIVIIDEWDVLIRDEASNKAVQEEYINFLRAMFKGTEPTKYISLVYMTGILPIKKLKTQSALNNFEEYTMLDAGELAPYIGFTEDEVRKLCEKYQRDFEKVKCWYDGYLLENQQIYNPKAVVSVMTRGKFKSYWSQTGTYESVVPLVNMNFDGLKTAILTMLAGDEVKVKTMSFQNDMVTFKKKDDVLTLLIHLGYLAYNQEKQTSYIPNEEIRSEFIAVVEENRWNDMIEFERESENLLNFTLNQDEEAVAKSITKIHEEYTSVVQYNDENSLSSVLAIAYLSTLQYYFKPIRELPTGKGFADFVFLPKPEYVEEYPALLVELKWNQSAKTALKQIKERNYPQSILEYTGKLLLVGINYDKKMKRHECKIEEYQKEA